MDIKSLQSGFTKHCIHIPFDTRVYNSPSHANSILEVQWLKCTYVIYSVLCVLRRRQRKKKKNTQRKMKSLSYQSECIETGEELNKE